jgi:hypothetical protein
MQYRGAPGGGRGGGEAKPAVRYSHSRNIGVIKPAAIETMLS